MDLWVDREAESAASVIVHHTTNGTLGQQLYKRSVERYTLGFSCDLSPIMSALNAGVVVVKWSVNRKVTRRTQKISPVGAKLHRVR